MIRHPAPSVIAKQLRHLADTLDDEGLKAIQRAAVLAARGYPTSTGGSGVNGSRSTTSSTERAAGLPGNERGLTPPLFAGIDEHLAKLLHTTHQVVLRTENTIGRINSHADDRDPTPVGQGECICCGYVCKPSKKKPNNRRKLELCPTCYRAFRRWYDAYPGQYDTVKDGRDDWLYFRWRVANPEGTREAWLKLRKAQIAAA